MDFGDEFPYHRDCHRHPEPAHYFVGQRRLVFAQILIFKIIIYMFMASRYLELS